MTVGSNKHAHDQCQNKNSTFHATRTEVNERSPHLKGASRPNNLKRDSRLNNIKWVNRPNNLKGDSCPNNLKGDSWSNNFQGASRPNNLKGASGPNNLKGASYNIKSSGIVGQTKNHTNAKQPFFFLMGASWCIGPLPHVLSQIPFHN